MSYDVRITVSTLASVMAEQLPGEADVVVETSGFCTLFQAELSLSWYSHTMSTCRNAVLVEGLPHQRRQCGGLVKQCETVQVAQLVE